MQFLVYYINLNDFILNYKMVDIPRDKDNSVYSYMNWKTITNKSTNQYKLKKKHESYDSKGLADINGRKVIACVKRFGNIGDEIEVTFQNKVYYWNGESGTLFAIIGDYKSSNDSNCDGWGHKYGEKQRSVIEFIVGDGFRGNIKDAHNFPDLRNNPVVKIERTGVNFL